MSIEALRLEARAYALECERLSVHWFPMVQHLSIKRWSLTICNAGALATEDYGTVMGVIRAAFDQGKEFQCYAAETRPFLQVGTRLDRLGTG